MESAITHLRAPAGRLALTHLNFDQEMITVAMEAEEWMRDVPQADYCDIVVVAQLHDALTESARHGIPRLDETPVFARLGLGEFDPQTGLKVLREGKAIAEAVQQMLV
jgi:HD-like signal output (HDOD) protein